MLDWWLMKRLLLFALALNLTGLGQAPLSVCALFSSKAAECVKPETRSECDTMDMGTSGAKVSPAPGTSCCDLSRAPVPESQQKASGVDLTAISHTVRSATEMIAPVYRIDFYRTEQDSSPPLLQSFLCTFLI